ncbi:hypothetical protein HGA92_05010 [Candidatus Gracilibacteria bacterium]|nr:hypothetical protein [Candidatus Gracilibacteria bacterium]NUJ98408.1 hypothetical protein [Candidatus Gracilibacteria bacterium]
MNKVLKYIKLTLIIFSLSALIVFFFAKETYKDFGKIAWYLLIIVMLVRPLSDIFTKCKILNFILKIRRELGILSAVFGIAHTIGAFILYMERIQYTKNYLEIMFEPYMWTYDKLLFGMLAFLVSIPLLITSNGLFTSLLGKYWKTLQRLSYFMFTFVALHIYFLKGKISALFILGAWIIVYIFAFVKKKFFIKKALPKGARWICNVCGYIYDETVGDSDSEILPGTKFEDIPDTWKCPICGVTKKDFTLLKEEIKSAGPKWLCVPCGYIYDEIVGDPDSGVLPGTKFEDIPDTWVCPICGVRKKNFILLKGEIVKNEGEIVSLEYLTTDVIELKLDIKKELEYTSGQFLTFALNDENGDFNRSYSIADKTGNILTFLIKLKSDGKAGILLRTKKVGDKIVYTNISGDFKLKNTSNPKVFIATGTGLAPIYSMLTNTPEKISKKLYFGVANLSDMFYGEKLKNIQNLELNLYLSREQVEGYNFGRINLENKEFDTNTEFYICGNPGVVTTTKELLGSKGFTQVYSEEF